MEKGCREAVGKPEARSEAQGTRHAQFTRQSGVRGGITPAELRTCSKHHLDAVQRKRKIRRGAGWGKGGEKTCLYTGIGRNLLFPLEPREKL